GFLLIGAVPRPWTDARMIAAGVGALGVDGTEPGLAIQVETVPVGQAGQREYAVLLVEVLDDAGVAPPSGDVAKWFVALEGVDYCTPDQAVDAPLHRQGAAGGDTGAAPAVAVAGPGVQAIRVGGGDQLVFHGGGIGGKARDDNGWPGNFQWRWRVEAGHG